MRFSNRSGPPNKALGWLTRIQLRTTSVILLFTMTMMACASPQVAEGIEIPRGIPLRGRVIYPDGSPAGGAQVVAETVCEDSRVRLSDGAVTDADGSFGIATFDTSCRKLRFTAEKRDGFWLRTGKEVFYPRPNGTVPQLELVGAAPPEPVTIQLDLRGGELELAVWDESVKRRIQAGLDVECPKAWCGAMSIATGEDGSAHTIFVAPRRYKVSLNYYPCGAKTYFAKQRPSLIVDVVEGQRQFVLLKVDTRLVPAKSSYDNPKGESCQPSSSRNSS